MATTRRGRGEGSVAFDRDAERWIGRLDLGRDGAGHRVRVKVSGAAQPEARRKLNELRRQHEAGVLVAERNTTFAELAELWLQRGLRAEIAQITRDNYVSMIRLHLLPALGHRRVNELRPEHIEAALDVMAAGGAAGSSLRHALGLTRRILRLGERRGLVIRNVAGPVEAPRGPTR